MTDDAIPPAPAPAPEFRRPISLRQIPGQPVELTATEAERTALAKRFGISAVDRLVARISLDRQGERISAEGTLEADIVQPCAVSGEDFPVSIEEDVALRFVPEGSIHPSLQEGDDIEIELEEGDLDEIEYSGDSFDLGEAVAQTLALAIDPYAEGPNADAAREKAGIKTDDAPSGPLAEALGAALKKG
ncbi:YceD family protein [Alteriqipengyuania sp. 357]